MSKEAIRREVKLLKESAPHDIDSHIFNLATILLNSVLTSLDSKGNEIRIKPQWIEAYLYKEGLYEPDHPACHREPGQQNNMLRYYFHRDPRLSKRRGGRGGVDICLSDETGFWFSFLIKRSAVLDTGDFKKEMELESKVLADHRGDVDVFGPLDPLIKTGQCTRIHLPKACGTIELKKAWAFYDSSLFSPSPKIEDIENADLETICKVSIRRIDKVDA